MQLLARLRADRTGTSAVEYAFIAALIAVGSLVGVKGLGNSVTNSYNNTSTAVHDAVQ